jgi:hypothetical protein
VSKHGEKESSILLLLYVCLKTLLNVSAVSLDHTTTQNRHKAVSEKVSVDFLILIAIKPIQSHKSSPSSLRQPEYLQALCLCAQFQLRGPSSTLSIS